MNQSEPPQEPSANSPATPHQPGTTPPSPPVGGTEVPQPWASSATRPPSAPSPGGSRRNRFGAVVLGIAVLALLASFGSAVVSWRALDQARTARDIASARSPIVVPTATPAGSESSSLPSPSDPAVTPDGGTGPAEAPRSPGQPPVLNERTVYQAEYEAQSLTLNPAKCFAEMYVDLDEPRANVGLGSSDLTFSPDCQAGAPYVQLGAGVDGSEMARAGMRPQECADAIRAAPIAENAEVPLRKGSWLCVSTSYAKARERRDDWRMVLIEVVSISNERSVVLRATAWNIPED
ncbi:hypothetical protein [Micromonospora echinofusca]|uniref:hypothetical protein n=1 Tax=Micromonospora echinofusca TaxID=47858 RepID=UPI0033DCA1F4